ncbi:MAG: NADH:flavin oxidoreductase/NADH oxidase [Proteobacteria bacterium]|nr:NADH:flavin oxidoreductase/NADH oxidase [Pseudomonadota bacterium]
MPNKSALFSPLKIRDIVFKNRIFVSPMCQYSANEGIPNEWHLVHLGSRAVGQAALVMAEATAVSASGRISPADTGLWSQSQVETFKTLTRFIKEQGCIAAVQLAHAGRKASTSEPWRGGKPLSIPQGGWTVWAPSSIPFSSGYPTPQTLKDEDLSDLVRDFERATQHALLAGFEVLELHMAHGYLLHEFLSPLSNQRQDEFGGHLENRIRLPLMIVEKVRTLWPKNLPLFVRVSATDWVEGGWDLSQTISFVRELGRRGVDLIDVSTGGLVPSAKIPISPGFQVPFATEIKKETSLLTGAVGLITQAQQAEEIVATEKADVVFIAREFLRDPYFPIHAAKELGVEISWPHQYERAQ